MKTAFLDSSVLFTAVKSPTGGSSKLFTLKNVHLVVSLIILVEVERNVRKKLQPHNLERFFHLTEKVNIIKLKPDQKLINKARNIIVDKDAVILAESKQSKCDFLVTLDMKHFFKKDVHKFISPNKIVTPKMLIENITGK